MKNSIRILLGDDTYTRLQRQWKLRILPKISSKYFHLRLYFPFYRPSLEQIGRFNGTDKSDEAHSFCGKSYLVVYESYLKHLREKFANILEIGVLKGASLRTWRDYSKKWEVFGIDINPTARLQEGERIRISIGSQTDEYFVQNTFGSEIRYSLIIDDGSHVNSMTLKSFHALFYSRLDPGGFYIIEDLGCSYYSLEGVFDQWPGMNLNNRNESYINKREDMDRFFESIIRNIDHREGDAEYIHFWHNTCIIKKREDILQ